MFQSSSYHKRIISSDSSLGRSRPTTAITYGSPENTKNTNGIPSAHTQISSTQESRGVGRTINFKSQPKRALSSYNPSQYPETDAVVESTAIKTPGSNLNSRPQTSAIPKSTSIDSGLGSRRKIETTNQKNSLSDQKKLAVSKKGTLHPSQVFNSLIKSSSTHVWKNACDELDAADNPHFSAADLNKMIQSNSLVQACTPIRLTRFNYRQFKDAVIPDHNAKCNLATEKQGGSIGGSQKPIARSMNQIKTILNSPPVKLNENELGRQTEQDTKKSLLSRDIGLFTSTSSKNKLVQKKKAHHRVRSSISEGEFLQTNVCKHIHDIFDKKMLEYKIKLHSRPAHKEKIGPIRKKELLQIEAADPTISSKMDHGATHVNIFVDREKYKANKISQSALNLYKDKVSNIPKFCNTTAEVSQYQKTLDEYQVLYRECLLKKKVPNLTEYIKKNQTIAEKKTNDFSVYVRYNPDAKSKL